MADTFTPLLRLVLQEDQGNINIWGDIYNKSVIDLVDTAIRGRTEVDVTTANVQLSVENGAPDESRSMFLVVAGDPGVAREVIVPTLQKLYVVVNETSPAFDVEIKTADSSGVSVSAGDPALLYVDQTANKVRGVAIAGTTITEADNLQNAVAVFNNSTGGQSSLQWSYTTQGRAVYVETGAIDTTIASTGFQIDFGTVPAAIIPGQAGSPTRNFPVWVDEDGAITRAYLQIPPSDNLWHIFKADGTNWTNGSRRRIRHRISVYYDQITD